MSLELLALLFTFIVLVVGLPSIMILIILLSRDTTKIPEIITRIANIESLVGSLISDVNAEIAATTVAQQLQSAREIWRTSDGKYEANSFEELLTKMSQDPDSPLTPEEIESIHSIFRKIMGVQSDEDDDESTGWKKSN